MIDTVGKFWIVTMPSKVSMIGDICFATDIIRLFNQVRGGLKEEEIRVITKDKSFAESAARKLIMDMTLNKPAQAIKEKLSHMRVEGSDDFYNVWEMLAWYDCEKEVLELLK